jgi:nicotinamide-nucleotide amidase
MEPEQSLNVISASNASFSTAESITCGYLSYLLTSLSGASRYFRGGLSLYQNQAKTMFDVDPDIIKTFGAISPETARELAKSAKKHFDTDYCIGIAGNAGPTPDEFKPIGVSYLAILTPTGIEELTIDLSKYRDVFTRDEMRKATAIEAVIFLASIIKKE